MEAKSISEKQQRCVSDCIFEHWGQHSRTDPARRDESYAQCLTECRLCE